MPILTKTPAQHLELGHSLKAETNGSLELKRNGTNTKLRDSGLDIIDGNGAKIALAPASGLELHTGNDNAASGLRIANIDNAAPMHVHKRIYRQAPTNYSQSMSCITIGPASDTPDIVLAANTDVLHVESVQRGGLCLIEATEFTGINTPGNEAAGDWHFESGSEPGGVIYFPKELEGVKLDIKYVIHSI